MDSNTTRVSGLVSALAVYRDARLNLLAALGGPVSNRDPLSEFAEQFVAALTGGVLATNRVQRDWDLTLPDGSLVQVKYLANGAGGPWVNEHTVHVIPGVGWYALVIVEDFEVSGVVMFPLDRLGPVGAALGKRHPNLDTTLQFTRANWVSIRDNPERHRALGLVVFMPPFGGAI